MNNQALTGRHPIHRLPREVLSLVFVMGENMQRGLRTSGLPYAGLQDIVVVSYL